MDVVVIGLTAVFFAGLGLYGLAAPASLIAPFGITLEAPESRAEVRAVYGGFGVAMAGLLTWTAVDDRWREPVAAAVGIALLGMAFGRLVSRAMDRPAGFYPIWFYFWVEVVAGGALIAVVTTA